MVTFEQVDRALPSSLTASQSILLIWPQLVGVSAIVVVVFAGAYVAFMGKEVRA